MHPQYITHIV